MNIVIEKKMSMSIIILFGVIIFAANGDLSGKIIALISILFITGLSVTLHELGHVWGFRKVGYEIEKIEVGLGGGSVEVDTTGKGESITPDDIIIIILPAILVTLFLTIMLYIAYISVDNSLMYNIIKASLVIHIYLLLFNSYPFFSMLDGGKMYFSILWKIMGQGECYYTFLARYSKIQLCTSYILAFAAMLVITFYKDNVIINTLSLMTIFLAVMEFKYINHLIEIGEVQGV